MSFKGLVLNLVLVAATSLAAVLLAGYICSAAITRAGHGSQFAQALADPTPPPSRHAGLRDALSLRQSTTDARAR